MSLKISQIITIIEVLILNLKRGEILTLQDKDQLVVSLVGNMWVNALFGLIVSMVVAKVHMVKDCPNVINQGKGNGQTQPSVPTS